MPLDVSVPANHLGPLESNGARELAFLLLAAYANRGCLSLLPVGSLKSHLKRGAHLLKFESLSAADAQEHLKRTLPVENNVSGK